MTRSSRRGSTSLRDAPLVLDGRRPARRRPRSVTNPPRSTQRRSAVAVPLSSRAISSRSSTSRSSRSTRSRIGVADLVVVEQAGRRLQPGQRRAQVVGDVRHEPPLALDPHAHRLGHPVDRLAQLRDLVMAGGIDPRVQLAGGHPLGDRRRPPQPQREAAGQQQAEQRPADRRRHSHLDHRLAQVAQLLRAAARRSRARRSRPPVRRAPARPDRRLAVPAAAVGGQPGPCAPRRAAAPAPTGRWPAAPSGAATAWSAGRSAPPTAPGPPPRPGPRESRSSAVSS